MQKILMTGAAGRVGKYVCRHLVEQGYEVRATDRSRKGDLPIPLKVVNLLDRESCYDLVDGIDAVVHFANHPSHYSRDFQNVLIENTAVNMNLFQAAVESGVQKIIYASSVQGMVSALDHEEPNSDDSNLDYLPIDSDHPAKPGNPYGLSKQFGEEMMRYFSRVYGVSCIACRFPFMVSPRWLPHFMYYYNSRRSSRRFRSRKPYSRATADEGFSYLSCMDAARLIEAILEAELPGFRVYFPVQPRPYKDESVAELVQELYQNVPLKMPAEEMTSLVDISRITEETGWVPQDDVVEMQEEYEEDEESKTEA